MSLKIENDTPWRTEDLAKFLGPLCEKTGTTEVSVVLHRAEPGAKRSDQTLFEVNIERPYKNRGEHRNLDRIEIKLISPKRAEARTDLLDRMAQSLDLAPNEAAMPVSIIQGILHAFDSASYWLKGGRYERSHLTDQCHCDIKSLPTFLIRGDTKAKTALPIDIEGLRRKLSSSERSTSQHQRRLKIALKDVARIEGHLRSSITRSAKLEARISKEEAKQSSKRTIRTALQSE